MKFRWKSVRKWWAIIGGCAGLGFTLWSLWAFRAHGPKQLFESDERVQVVIRDQGIYLLPSRREVQAGLLFFPGGLVDPRAYIPLVRRIADRGVSCAIVKVPFRGAFVEGGEVQSRAAEVIKELGQSACVVAGHSKGARFAAEFARAHPDVTQGLVLIGSSHPREIDLSALTIPVTKIYATNDGLASPARVRAASGNLPAKTRWVLIRGGNHSQFAWYGFSTRRPVCGDQPSGSAGHRGAGITAQPRRENDA